MSVETFVQENTYLSSRQAQLAQQQVDELRAAAGDMAVVGAKVLDLALFQVFERTHRVLTGTHSPIFEEAFALDLDERVNYGDHEGAHLMVRVLAHLTDPELAAPPQHVFLSEVSRDVRRALRRVWKIQAGGVLSGRHPLHPLVRAFLRLPIFSDGEHRSLPEDLAEADIRVQVTSLLIKLAGLAAEEAQSQDRILPLRSFPKLLEHRVSWVDVDFPKQLVAKILGTEDPTVINHCLTHLFAALQEFFQTHGAVLNCFSNFVLENSGAMEDDLTPDISDYLLVNEIDPPQLEAARETFESLLSAAVVMLEVIRDRRVVA